MTQTGRSFPYIVCDPSRHARRLTAEVLGASGFEKALFAREGAELLKMTEQFQPRIVITSSRVPNLSGLEYTRLIRAGYKNVSRALSIIVMTDTPTARFLEAARESGVDEMLVRPFTGAALLARVEAVLVRPRRFIESVHYVGPCRRRRMLDEYAGPMRRFTDPFEDASRPLWEAESNRALVRQNAARIGDLANGLEPTDRRGLREVFGAVRDAELLGDEIGDLAFGDSARSLSRYISAVGATGGIDPEVVTTHVDAMNTLGVLGADAQKERDKLVEGLVAVVDKRLGRKAGARAA